MTKFVTALSVLTFALGTAAYAGTPATVTSSAAQASSTAPRSTSTYSSTSSLFGEAANPDFPGATGRTIVRGTSSTIGGDSMATQMERTGAISAN